MNQLSFCRHKTYTADALPLGTLLRNTNGALLHSNDKLFIVASSRSLHGRLFVSLSTGSGWEAEIMGVIVDYPVTLTPEPRLPERKEHEPA